MKPTTHIQSIQQLHHVAGLEPPKHPLFSILQLEHVSLMSNLFPERLTFNFYTVGLKKNLDGYITYGRTHYDFQEGVLGFTTPYQLMEFNHKQLANASGWIFCFQRELLNNSILQDKMEQFGFFHYQTNEGLHLSKIEEQSLILIFKNIKREYELPIDSFSKQVVISNLELLLTYSHRYYERQFIVRNDIDSNLVTRFQILVKMHFKKQNNQGLPTVEQLANQMHLSANYLSDYLKTATGKTAMEHIHQEIIIVAKKNYWARINPFRKLHLHWVLNTLIISAVFSKGKRV